MENKTQTETIATRKTIQNPEVKILMQELNDKDRKGVSLSEYEVLLAKAKRLSEKLGDSTILEKAVITAGEKLIMIGSNRQAGRNARISSLETALKLLFDFYGKQKDETSIRPAVLVLIARACYERSVLILSKQDKVMVEKKKRIIKKGIEFAKEAIVKESNKKEALRLRGILLLELEKIDKDDLDLSDLKEALSGAIQKGCTEFDKNPYDIEITLRLAEIAKKDVDGKPLPKEVIDWLQNIAKTSLPAKNIELKKAKAHYLLGNKENHAQIKTHMETFAENLESLPFSDPGWSEAAGFVRELEKAGKDCWKEIAMLVWGACKKRYKKSTTVEHYWYFGHLVNHYYIADLAFAAQDDIEKKVEIADFLKSKILFHGQALDDEAERFWEYNKDVRQQRFIKRMEMVYETEKKRTSGANRRGFKEIPQDCVIIHFYLNKLKKKGYAILADSSREWEIKEFPYAASIKITGQTVEKLQNKGVPCEIVKGLKNLVDKDTWYATVKEMVCALEAEIVTENTAQYKEAILENVLHVNLFEAFISWQTNYFVNKPTYKPKYLRSTTTYLIELCKEIWRVMPFLFDIANKQVLFIPHDFLHRLPLHAAIKINAANSIEEVFLEKHLCYFLPAWSFTSKEDAPVGPKGKIMLNWFSEHEDEDKKAYKYLSELKWKEFDDFENILSPPELLIIGCHGKADVTSPFNSELYREEGNVTLLKTLTSKMDINGSCVLLSACEADLVPPLSGTLDEHLSFASALLIKNARQVLGGMWIIWLDNIKKIINGINNCSSDNLDVGVELWHWQKKEIKNGIREYCNDKSESTTFFLSATFRVYGLPKKVPFYNRK